MHDQEADTVRLIFSLFLQRQSYNEIADTLNARGIPRPAIAKGLSVKSNTAGWNRTGVRNLIDDARYYAGEYVAYQRATRDDVKDKQVIVPVPAIIDCATYEKVQFIRSTLRRQPIYTEYDPFTLTRRMSCQCGYNYSQQKTMRQSSLYRYYRCNATNEKYNRNNAVCTIRSIPADRVETAVWNFIKSLLLDPQTVIARHQQHNAQQQAMTNTAQSHLTAVDELLAELDTEREQLLTLFRKRYINEDRLDADMVKIDRQQEKLTKERDRSATILAQLSLQTESLASLESLCTELRKQIDHASPEKIIRIYDRLQLRIHVVTEDDQVVAYVTILDCDAGKVVVNAHSARYPLLITKFVFRIPIL